MEHGIVYKAGVNNSLIEFARGGEQGDGAVPGEL